MVQLITNHQLTKLTCKEVADALGIGVQNTSRAIQDMLRGLARDWLADPDRTLMTILLFMEHGERMYPPTCTPNEIPPSAYRYLKAGKLARVNLTAFFGLLLKAVGQARLLQPTKR